MVVLSFFFFFLYKSYSTLPSNSHSKCHRGANGHRTRASHRSRIARFGAAARTIVSNVVPVSGDFEDGPGSRVAAVVVVY